MSGSGTLMRDQVRALHAYESVRTVPHGQRDDYKIAVNDLGATIMRSGLAAAMSALERQKSKGDKKGNKAADLLLEHLAGASIPGLDGVQPAALPARIRGLAVDEYILVTRELLKVVIWFRRAVQATIGDGES